VSPTPAIDWRHGEDLPADRPTTLAGLCAAAAERAAQAVVLRDAGREWTWPDLARGAGRLARAWQHQVPAGAVIALSLANGAAHLLVELAAWQLGAVAAPLWTGLPQTARSAVLARLRPVLVIADDGPGPHVSAAEVLAVADRPGATAGWRAVTPDHPALILATSGSTGEPRLVVLSHDNLCSQQAAFAMLWPEVGPGDRLASYLPWHHSFGALAERLWSLCRGARLTVVPGGGRDQAAFLATVQAVRPTRFLSVPKLHQLAQAHGVLDLQALRWAFTAGAPPDPAIAAWYAQRGIPLIEGWGLTETSPSATITRGEPRRTGFVGSHHPGLVGLPIPGVAVGVAEDGRIWVAGPGVMRGYADGPAGVVCDPPGPRRIDSGDLGRWTAEGLVLVGRADRMIKLANGEKADLGAIERFLEGQPGVRCAAVALAEGRLCAVLVPGDGHAADACRQAWRAWNRAAPAPWLRLHHADWIARPATPASGLLTASHKTARSAVLADPTAQRLEA
jgi:long-subunit acyl-CoA synthetase (AMP-forming)